MPDFFKDRWPLLVVLILFVMIKIPALLLPFYWDESWPYAPALISMHQHGISLLPTALDPDLSRGHPLFFHSAAALWMDFFGTTYKSLHAFALFISLLFLVTIYEAGYRIFNKRVAVISLVLLATNIFFYVQSTFVLLEVLVALLSFLSIYLYVQGKYIYAALSLTALFLTKESGLVAGFIIGIDALVSFFDTREKLHTRLLKLFPVTIACVTIGAFFLLQKHYRGWYVFPLHAETVLRAWPDILYRFRTCAVNTTFCMGYEDFIFLALLLFIIIAVIKMRNTKNLALLFIIIPGTLVYYFISDERFRAFTPGYDVAAVIAFIVFYVITIFSFAAQRFYDNSIQKRFIILLGFFVLFYILFSSFAFFTPRYMLSAIIPVLFLLAIFFDMLLRHSYGGLYYPLLLVIGISVIFSFKDDKGLGDCTLGYKYGVKTQLAVVEYMERSNFYDKHITAGAFLERVHLTNRNTGYLSTDRVFKYIDGGIDSTTELIIFDNIEPDIRYNQVLKDPHFEMVYHIDMHGVWADIFRRKQ